MINIKQQEKIFLDIALNLKKPITTYAIGGTAMMLKGLKEESVDMDIVFTSEEDRQAFKSAVKVLGFEDFDEKIVYGKRANAPEMVNVPDCRIDLFLNQVINFAFTEGAKERAKDTHVFHNNLIIKVADMHDIIVMKCATNRSKDEEDIISIVKNEKINWDILVGEAEAQIKLGNERAVLALGTTLEKLVNNYKIAVPKEALDKLWKMLKRQVKNKSKKYL